RLNQGLSARLTLISAPAGFGKTTLLSEWIAASGLPAAWVSLDARDDDPLRFARYLLAALETLELGGGGPAWPRLAPADGAPQLETVLTAVINEVSQAPDDFALVLDDYHLITAEAIHAALQFLLEHLPPQMHLVITSRTDPPLGLAHLRARGQLVELRAADLRFSPAEARTFLSESMGLSLPEEALAALEARSEGWIASLQLAALAIQATPASGAPADFIQAFSGRHPFVVDYLAEQVLRQQPEAVQTFLLETSILERLTAPLCEAVLGDNAAAQPLLERLERANLFLTPLDAERQWFRYHPLLAEFLQARLRQTAPERWALLHRRAADWCERSGLMEEAVRHALAARDFELATRLIERVAETLWSRSQILTMLSWIKAMPAELVRAQPRLCIQSAWAAAINGQLDEVEPLLTAAEAGLGPRPAAPAPTDMTEAEWQAAPGRLWAQVSILRGFVARFRGDLAGAIAHSQRALAQIPAGAPRMRSVALIPLGHAYVQLGEAEAANQALTEAMDQSRATGHVAAYLSAANYLALLRVQEGRLREAAALYREALRLVTVAGEASYSGIERIGLGTILREQNDLEQAAGLIEAGLPLAERGGDFTFMRDAYLARAGLDQARGDWDSALDYAGRAEQVARRSASNRDLSLISALRARLLVSNGQVDQAAEWARASGVEAAALAGGAALPFTGEYAHLSLARVLLAQGRWLEAGGLLGRLQRAAEAAGRHGRLIEILALEALRLQALGQDEAALAALDRAVKLAEPEGYARVFLDEGAPMLALLNKLHPNGCEASTEPAVSSTAPTAPLKPAPQLAEPLSERESDVLRLVAAGLSNQAIAEQLVLAPSTIQWHVKNIYSKLNVHSRTQAARMARELGL
ncbi:MAG: LuxR C-terminal-related transcriptional regulator, partial [Anaerolineales bacterium]